MHASVDHAVPGAPDNISGEQGVPWRHVLVDGVKIFDGPAELATAYLASCIEQGRGARVATANLDFLVLARRDAILRQDLNSSTLVVADGAPVAWLAKRAGGSRVTRLAGVDLVQSLCTRAPAGRRLRLALYGSTFEHAHAAAARLAGLSDSVEIALILCPPFRPLTDEEREQEQEAIAASRPDLVLVALGCPRQERLIATYYEAAPQAVWIGVGGTFEILGGARRRAPGWMQRGGMEWVARLAQEPGRLWKRYLLRDIPFLLRLAPRYLIPRQAQQPD